MKQIEAHDKRQPVFMPGSGARVAAWLVVLFFCIGVGVSVDYMFGPTIRAAARFITDLVFG